MKTKTTHLDVKASVRGTEYVPKNRPNVKDTIRIEIRVDKWRRVIDVGPQPTLFCDVEGIGNALVSLGW